MPIPASIKANAGNENVLWNNIPGDATDIDINETEAWIIGRNKSSIYMIPLSDTTADSPMKWKQISGNARYISVSNKEVWILNNGRVYYSLAQMDRYSS